MGVLCSVSHFKVQDLGQQSKDVGGVQRSFVAYVPVGASPTGLIVALHGAGMDGSTMCEWSVRASDIVSTTGAVVVCPTSTKDANPDALGKGRRLQNPRDEMAPNQNIRMLSKAGWIQLDNGTYYNTETGETVDVGDKKSDDGKMTKDEGENEGNSWKAFPGFDNAEDVNFLADLIKDLKVEYKIPDGRVLMAGFSNGGSMAYRFNCEKSHLIDGLVIDGFVWTDPYKPMATPVSKPPYRQCEAANLTKKTPLYTVCGTEDVYCKQLDFLGSWKDYSVGVFGCAGETKQVGHFPNHPPGAMTCYGYDSCPMNTACEISGHEHTGTSADDAIHFAFGSFFNVTVEPLPQAKVSNYPGKGKEEEKGKEMEGPTKSGKEGFLGEKQPSEKAPTKTSSPSTSAADGSFDPASSSFHALLSGIVIVLAFANCAVTVWV